MDTKSNSFTGDRAVIDRMQKLCSRSLELYASFFDSATCWPYKVEDGDPVEFDKDISVSTTAMILHACGVVTGTLSHSLLTPVAREWWAVDAPAGLDENIRAAADKLVSKCHSSGESVTTSTTWGDDDPLTLLWLIELLAKGAFGTESGARSEVLERATERARERVSSVLEQPDVPVLQVGRAVTSAAAERDSKQSRRHSSVSAVPHVFPILRTVQLARLLNSLEGGQDVSGLDEVTAWLDTQLHRHLSYREIVNSDFDPAELIFALEALLIARDGRVSDTIVSRVLEVMASSGSQGGYWRPIRPLRVDSRGSILLPQSVEVANSLLRICDILDSRDRTTYWASQMFETLSEYTEWLEARLVSGQTDTGARFEGWQSDHTHREGLVHLWATSQALLYCSHYGSLAQALLASSLREQNKISVQSTLSLVQKGVDAEWPKIAEKEPMLGLPESSRSRVYNEVWTSFVEPRLGGQKGASSMLLYGPPGTGKTSFAESLATVLRYDLIIITPSDFIELGEAGVEARASRIFETLMQQSNAVVLFDEIDRLILSRDHPKYGEQSDMFQFMTPSMLTKLNNLRREGRVVFVIATNYEDRIDSAIKRAGRIDRSLLLLPPDRAQRSKIVASTLVKDGRIAAASAEDIGRKVAEVTGLFAYQEIRALCDSAIRAQTTSSDEGLREALISRADELPPAISLEAYEHRFEFDDGRVVRGPVREFLFLAYLMAEVDKLVVLEEHWMGRVIRYGLDVEAPEPIVKDTLLASLG